MTVARAAFPFALIACVAGADAQCVRNAYRQTNLVSNMPEVEPQILDPLLIDGWSVAIRPPGAGGHFWVANRGSGTVSTYVGDVPGVPLYQDELTHVGVPSSIIYANLPETVSQPTGQVYTGRSKTDFMISGEGVTGPATFLFVALDGTISGWRDGMSSAVNVFDDSASGAMFTGIAVTEESEDNRIWVCDFGLETLRCFDKEFKEIPLSGGAFRDPRVPGYVTPWNIQYLQGRLYIAWARQGDDPGEEEPYPGYGWVSCFDTEGNLLQTFEHVMELNAPWGLAIAPHDFGALSNTLLVANFGDGTTIAFDLETGKFIDYLRDEHDAPVFIDGIWGYTFGNGVRLGRLNHLYFVAGPNVELDGLFGKLAPVTPRSVDLDGSGRVDFPDLGVLYRAYGKSAEADLNGDEATDFEDLDILLGRFGQRCD